MPELMAEIVDTMNMISAGNPAMPKKNVDSPDLPEGTKNFILAFNILLYIYKRRFLLRKKSPTCGKSPMDPETMTHIQRKKIRIQRQWIQRERDRNWIQ